MLSAEKEDEQITLQEFLERERRMEVEAGEALPGKFDKCTWAIKEKIVQLLYVCRSCVKETDNPAVVCYSCSISCHSKCDLIELYEKRNFRCDCGNSLFKNKCSLEPNKDALNTGNNYEGRPKHNFFGRFCTCDQFFGSEQEEKEMYQCLVCEDWYHDSCIPQIPDPDAFDSFVCWKCVEEEPYLQILEGHENIKSTEDFFRDHMCWSHLPICFSSADAFISHSMSSRFLKGDIQDIICKCQKCVDYLGSHSHLSFLVDLPRVWEPEPDDEAVLPTYDIALRSLNQTGNKVVVDHGIYMFNDLTKKLSEYLKELSQTKTVITKEDIDIFMSKYNNKFKIGPQ